MTQNSGKALAFALHHYQNTSTQKLFHSATFNQQVFLKPDSYPTLRKKNSTEMLRAFELFATLLLFSISIFCEGTLADSHPESNGAAVPLRRPLRSETMAPGFAYARVSTPAKALTAQKKPKSASKARNCTARYWSAEGKESWPLILPLKSSVAKVFGSQAAEIYGQKMTLAEAMALREDEQKGDSFKRLLKQASAALINAYSREGFAYRAWRVKTLFIQALSSQRAAKVLASKFRSANRACSGLH